MSKSRKLAYLALFTTSIIWGFSPPIVKYTLQFISPTSFLFYRFLFVSIILLIPLILRLNRQRITMKQLSNYLLLGFLATPLNLYLWFVGLQKTTATDASIISITSPILVVLGGIIFLKEKVAKNEKIGLTLALTGTILTIIQPLLEDESKFGQNIIGNVLIFAGAAVWAAFTILFKKHKGLDPFVLTAFSFILGLILFFPLIIVNTFSFPSLPSLPGLFYMVIFGSVIAYFAYNWGVAKIEASEASVFSYLQPIFSVPLAAVWLGEKITLPFLIGGILIIFGVFICEKR